MSELRLNPLMGEWVATATHQQARTFLPPADFGPLCPTNPGGFPTEIPEATYTIVAFENRFPSLHPEPPAPAVEAEGRDLAAMLKTVLTVYDKLFNLSFPYMMVLHQRPTDWRGGDYEHYHFHIEFYPPLRTATKLKYLAGSESDAGMFINDTLAEEKAAELRSLVAPVVWKKEALL